MTDKYADKAIEYVAAVLEISPDNLSADDTIETVEKWDSLNHMRIVMHLEEVLDQTIDTEDIVTLFTMEGIANLLQKLDKAA